MAAEAAPEKGSLPSDPPASPQHLLPLLPRVWFNPNTPINLERFKSNAGTAHQPDHLLQDEGTCGRNTRAAPRQTNRQKRG